MRRRFVGGRRVSDRVAGVLDAIDAIRQEDLAAGTWPSARYIERRWWPADDAETGLTWGGLPRMARARRDAGLKLDARDVESLRRDEAAPTGVAAL